MNTDGHFYSHKKKTEKYSEELKSCIETTCQYCLAEINKPDEEKKNRPILMLGKIQSGKTRAYTGLIALAFDNGFDMVFILSQSNTALINQTVSRMKKEFKCFIDDCMVGVSDIMKCRGSMSPCELDERKNIIVAKKQKDNMAALNEFIAKNATSIRGKKCLIIDDEADATGIGFNKVKKKGGDTSWDQDKGLEEENKKKDDYAYTLREIRSKIDNLRRNLNASAYVEVTATPYALYLQPDDSDKNREILPTKPFTTVLVPSGDNYIGGSSYFIESKKVGSKESMLFERIEQEEYDFVSEDKQKNKPKRKDGRRMKDKNTLSEKYRLPMFRKGIINFFVGAIALKHIVSENSGESNSEKSRCPYCGSLVLPKHHTNPRFAYIIHTTKYKTSHKELAGEVEKILNKIKQKSDGNDTELDKLLVDSYTDIEESVIAYGKRMPLLEKIKIQFFDDIRNGRYRVDVVNSDKKTGRVESHLLNDETGELDLKVPYSIFVGGEVLARGVTIPNMIGFYYGRKSGQQDTVWQHARMFGYRKELLPVTRFYTTKQIYNNMEKIAQNDIVLREDIKDGNQSEVVFLDEDMQPCSFKKIIWSTIQVLTPRQRILPVGFNPVDKPKFEAVDNEIERILKECLTKDEETNADVCFLDKIKIEELLRWVYKTIEDDKNGNRFIPFEKMMKYFAATRKDSAYCVVYRNRDIAKYKDNNRKYEDAPDSGTWNEARVREKYSKEYPCLILFKEKGTNKGWGGKPFWWPLLIAPQNISKRIFVDSSEVKISLPE